MESNVHLDRQQLAIIAALVALGVVAIVAAGALILFLPVPEVISK